MLVCRLYEWLYRCLSLIAKQTEVSHFLGKVIPNKLLALNDPQNSFADNIFGLTLELRELVELTLNAWFDGQVFCLRLDKGVKNTLTFLIDNDDASYVFGSCSGRMALA